MNIATRTILNYSHKYTGTTLSGLCKRSYRTSIINRTWALSKLRNFPERYKIFLPCHRHESDMINELLEICENDTYRETEPGLIRSILKNSTSYKDTFFPSINETTNVSFVEMNKFNVTDWSLKSSHEIVRAFQVLALCYSKGTRYEHMPWNSICQICMEKLPEFTDSQIKLLLQCLIILKSLPREINDYDKFIELVDNECLKRFYPATVQELLLITDAFYQLCNYKSAYIRCAMRTLYAKLDKLSKTELVQTSYYLHIRELQKYVNISEIKLYFKENIQDFSGNEVGMIARACFLSKTRIYSRQLINYILNKTIDSIQSMDSIFISYIMKVLRYNTRATCVTNLKTLMDVITSELPKLSLPCITHILQTVGAFRIYNKPLLNGSLEIAVNRRHLMRLKDIERVLFTICSITPNTNYYNDICHQFLNEILSTYKINRDREVQRFPLSLVRILMFLTMKNIYVPELLEFIYNQQILNHKYNRFNFIMPELLILHCSVKIEFPQYEGPLLPRDWYTFVTEKNGSYNSIHKVDTTIRTKAEIVYICKDKLGVNIWADYIVPHYIAKDIIFAVDEENKPVDIELILSKMPQGSIKDVNELRSVKCYVIIIVLPTLMIDNVGYVGYLHQKLRQLNILGYTPIPIVQMEWRNLTRLEKEALLRKLIFKPGNYNAETVSSI